jgi:putative ABC transport system permease protein
MYAVLLGIFAAVAGVLATIGIYGVMAYSVAQRTREIGIRMALGAQPSEVLVLVLGQSMLITAIGIVSGLAGAAFATRYLQGMLFGLTPLDPATFVTGSLVFAAVAMLAAYLPARAATKVDPLVALRSE